ncbi:hypothetical protein O181_057613, partial [Austropuccinia psidii MF-1]|nr:hypothetical protein [Austropuccinia psidii MF-1]
SSTRESSSYSEASKSSIEIQTSPEPRGSITKEPFKSPAEVEVTTSSNQMDMHQDIPVINQKYKNSPEADITAIAGVRPESLSTGNNRDIPVSVQEPAYGSKTARVETSPKSFNRHHKLISSSEEVNGARKDRRTSEGLETNVFQRTSTADKSLVEKPKHVIRGSEEEVGPREGKQHSGSSPSIHKQKSASKSAKKAQENPKDQPEGKEKGKGKCKALLEQALPTSLQYSQEREDSHGQCVKYGKNSDGIQKQGRGKIEQIFSKEVDLVKLKLGNEILKVKEPQKTMIGLENMNKYNIVSLTQICARIESKVTLLNQPDDNSISFITRQLKELRIQVQNLENSTGHNAALFQEQLEESDKAIPEFKEDIHSSINNISLKNDLPRQSTPILDGNVLNLNNDLHHTISSNAEVETA